MPWSYWPLGLSPSYDPCCRHGGPPVRTMLPLNATLTLFLNDIIDLGGGWSNIWFLCKRSPYRCLISDDIASVLVAEALDCYASYDMSHQKSLAREWLRASVLLSAVLQGELLLGDALPCSPNDTTALMHVVDVNLPLALWVLTPDCDCMDRPELEGLLSGSGTSL